MFLSESTFKTIISSTPLISIDLVIKNSKSQFLLGYRNNKPAQGYWFVLGGRILKDESIEQAFNRLMINEVGVQANLSASNFKGVFEHFYDDNVFGNDITTHYVVLAYELNLDLNLDDLPKQQHCDYKWFSESEFLASADVHQHSKWYLDKYVNLKINLTNLKFMEK